MCVPHKGYLQQILSLLIINLNVKINVTLGMALVEVAKEL